MSVALALVAVLIELAVGYPDRLLRAIGHPVIWIGSLIALLDRTLNPNSQASVAVKKDPLNTTTSPLEGEVGSCSDPGGGCESIAAPPLPVPPPQGGREQGRAFGVALSPDGPKYETSDAYRKWLNLPSLRRIRGIIALLILLAVVGGAAFAAERLLLLLPFGLIAAALVASSLIAQRSLHDHVARVAAALEEKDVAAGREAVSQIVGRDVAALDVAGVARAAIESLAENFSDGVVAPIFWLALGGLPGVAMYKSVNTADSMIGHRTPRYEQFGWAAARLDDLLNLPASRLSALLLIAAAAITPGASAAQARRAVRRDARRHRSPNAGYPEAAMAGALGLSLAGPRVYGGVRADDAFMGDGRREANAADIRAALALYRRADALLIAVIAVLAATLIAPA